MGLNFCDQPSLERSCRVAHSCVVCPQVKLFHGQRNHEPIDEDDRQGAAEGFKRTAEQQSPLAAGAVLHHQQSQAADAESPGPHGAEGPGAQEVIPAQAVLRLAQESKNHGNHGEDCCGHERASLPGVDKSRRAQARRKPGGKLLGVRVVNHIHVRSSCFLAALFPYCLPSRSLSPLVLVLSLLPRSRQSRPGN